MINDLKKMIKTLQATVDAANKREESLTQERDNLKEEIDLLRKKLFGTSSEKRTIDIPGQLNFFNEAELEQNPEAVKAEDLEALLPEKTAKKRKARATDAERFKGVPVEKKYLELSEEEKLCPSCGTPLKEIGEEFVRRELVFVPAKLKVYEYYSKNYECPQCKLQDIPVIKKGKDGRAHMLYGMASAGTVAWVMYQKFCNGLPYYRQEKDWKQYGVEITRATMANWVIRNSEAFFLPDGNGVDLVLNIKKIAPNVEVILLTAHGNIPDGVQAIKNGAFDYITKGDDNNKIIPLISRAVEKAKMNVRLEKLEKKVGQMYSFDSILGESKVLKEAVSLAQKVSVTDVPVLLTGETGTGKEVFAQAIHYSSKRSKQNFVAVNCSSFSKELLESEMFGHKAGSFTGALKDKKGLFEEANNGTIFLDEIGEMAFELQAKLLRILETGEYIKIGDTKPTRVNVRIIAATNRNLQEEIKAGHFREDLFYRLSVFQVHLPSLRERTGDIRILATAFAKSFSEKLSYAINEMTPAFLEALEQQPWKGNIRELRNVIERSLIVCEGGRLDICDLPLEIQNTHYECSDDSVGSFELAAMERRHIARVLEYTKGNKTEAARLLKIGLTTLYRKIEEYKI